MKHKRLMLIDDDDVYTEFDVWYYPDKDMIRVVQILDENENDYTEHYRIEAEANHLILNSIREDMLEGYKFLVGIGHENS